jgi:phospholipase/lecithinase/hemolysin
MKNQRLAASLVLTLIALAGCHTDEKLNGPIVSNPIFQRYVSMGNSLTAGFQSGGINDSTQQRSYANLLSKAMSTSFIYPSLAGLGCPPPWENNITGVRVGGDTSSTHCDLRNASPYVTNNTAVPGARAEELLSNFGIPVSTSNALTTFFLGGRTQIETMQSEQPTFVSAWIGNNDVLGSLTDLSNPGDPALITPSAVFDGQIDSIAAAIAATHAKAVLIGVADVSAIPYSSKGSAYFCLSAAVAGGCGIPAALPPNFHVAASCAPGALGGLGDTTLVPWPVGVTLVLRAAQGVNDTLDCSIDQEVVTPAELAGLHAAVTAFNAKISGVAAANGWAFLDLNPTLLAARVDPSAVSPFPIIPPNPLVAPVTFGTLFSLDGVHPSSMAHRVIADSLAATINAKFNTLLPVPVCTGGICPAP